MTEGTRESSWLRFWHEPIRAERLAVLRLLFGLALLTDQLFQFLPNLALFFGPEGIAPAGVNDGYLLRAWRWPILLFHTDDMTIVSTAFAAWMAATFLFLIGWHTRLMAVLVWLGTMCFFTRNPNLKNGGDDVLQIALFLLMLSPCGRALSVDAWRRRSSRAAGTARDEPEWIEPWPVRLFQIQLCVIYLTTGLAKLGGTTWWFGTSIHNVLNDVTMARWSYAQLPLPIWITAVLTYFSVWYEVLFTPLVLWPRTRKWMLWLGVLFHLGIYLMIEVGWFSFYTIAMYGAWIPDGWWQRRFGPRAAGGAGAGPTDYRVYYDSLCPLCRRSRRTLERLDWRGRIVFRDIHDRATVQAELPGVSYARALKEMIVLAPSGKITGGFDGFRTLARVIPVGWPLVPFLYLPGVGFFGRRIYRWIARNRYRLLACENEICSLHLRALSAENLDEAEIERIVRLAKQDSASVP